MTDLPDCCEGEPNKRLEATRRAARLCDEARMILMRAHAQEGVLVEAIKVEEAAGLRAARYATEGRR